MEWELEVVPIPIASVSRAIRLGVTRSSHPTLWRGFSGTRACRLATSIAFFRNVHKIT